ncbi:DedA family protein [Romeria aff. gracilis LEGE 07310]|uniref:DedA family protein n=1 Tax=Vasconcelosia minhoensis LEGE 07310 TaxID=915328 RepID=A0A8J7DBA3_9CYAN|nr:DedA family protein [Romeria aff. gracilis LEGE 07310]
MLEWITNAIATLGYVGVALLMLLENVIPPIPSEIIMPLAGFAAARGELNFGWAVFAGTVGSVAGALLWYYIGQALGIVRVKKLVDRYGRWVSLSSRDVDIAQRWLLKRGYWAVGLCRVIPGVRTYISIPAGFARMKMLGFLTYSTVGTVIWVAFLTYAGYLLGDNYERIETYIAPVSRAVIIGLIAATVFWIARRRMNPPEPPG